MDSTNFSEQQVKDQIATATTFILDLFDEKHMEKLADDHTEVEVVEDPADVETRKRKAASPSKKSRQEILDGMNVDPLRKSWYDRMSQRSNTQVGLTPGTSVGKKNSERRKAGIIVDIKKDVEEYVAHCRSERFIKNALEQFGNAKYTQSNNGFDYYRITNQMMDGYYAQKYFDLMRWWSEEGNRRFKYVAKAASVVIGKPSHNGFQERVFSRGTYFDDALKQRLKEENFEKAVLNSLTQTKVVDLKKQMHWGVSEMKYDDSKVEVQDFYTKERKSRGRIFESEELEYPTGLDKDDADFKDIVDGPGSDDDDDSVMSCQYTI